MRLLEILGYYVNGYFSNISMLGCCVAFALILICLTALGCSNNFTKKRIWINRVFCSFALTLIISTTLLGRNIGMMTFSVDNLFATYLMIGKTYWWNVVYEIVLNVILYIPLGCAFILLGKKTRHVILISMLLSLGIESIQLVLGLGIFEICDIFHNTLGGVLGAVLMNILKKTRKNQ